MGGSRPHIRPLLKRWTLSCSGHKVQGQRSLGLDSMSTISCGGPWANCLTSLSFHFFFICTMWVIISIFACSERLENAVQGLPSVMIIPTNGSFVSPTYLWALGSKDCVLDIGPLPCSFKATHHPVACDQCPLEGVQSAHA